MASSNGFLFFVHKTRMSLDAIYFDYAATTPLDPRVFDAMVPYLNGPGAHFGNPNSLHGYGQEALAALDDARVRIARAIAASRDEIFFTGSATEANNLALRGSTQAFCHDHPDIKKPRIIVSAIEHASVRETAAELERNGLAEVVEIPVAPDGIVDLDFLERAINGKTALISCMWVNNETGVVQPVGEIASLVLKYKRIHKEKKWPCVHSDAAQAVGFFDVAVTKTFVDFLTLSAHKIYGPKGVGALYVRGGVSGRTCVPVITGGGQEDGLRAGTENVPGIVGFASALELCVRERTVETARMRDLGLYFIARLRAAIPELVVYGEHADRSPGIINVRIPEFHRLWLALNIAHIAVSTGSACHQRRPIPSHVLRAMGFGQDEISQSVRFSFGHGTTRAKIDAAIERIIMAYDRLKEKSAL